MDLRRKVTGPLLDSPRPPPDLAERSPDVAGLSQESRRASIGLRRKGAKPSPPATRLPFNYI